MILPRVMLRRSAGFRLLTSAAGLENHDAQLLQGAIAILEDSLHTVQPTSTPSPRPPPGARKTMDIKLSGNDSSMLDAYARFCINAGQSLGGHLPGPAPLPLRTQKWTVLSSPHVHKTAWTQLERRTHGKALKVYGLRGELLKRYIWYVQQHCPPDIQLECQMHEYIPLSDMLNSANPVTMGANAVHPKQESDISIEFEE